MRLFLVLMVLALLGANSTEASELHTNIAKLSNLQEAQEAVLEVHESNAALGYNFSTSKFVLGYDVSLEFTNIELGVALRTETDLLNELGFYVRPFYRTGDDISLTVTTDRNWNPVLMLGFSLW